MKTLSQKHKLYLLLLAAFNIMPILLVLLGNLPIGKAMTFYWLECAIIGFFFLVTYARYLLIFFAVTLCLSAVVYIVNPNLAFHKETIFIFTAIFSIMWLGYVEFGKTKMSQTIRRMNPNKRGVIYLSFVGATILITLVLTLLVTGEIKNITRLDTYFYSILILCALISASISIVMIKLIDMVGQKHFIDFVTGTYHDPVEKDCIVMFLDMVGSSSMAEKLDAKKSMDLIGRFIYDSSYIFRINGGDIINYTGDGLVVLWPSKSADSALMAAEMIRKHFNSKQTKAGFWKRFGVVPRFRIGIHAGSIVLNQIGEEKLFLGVYGDVMNTAARLEQLNKELDTDILLSQDVGMLASQAWRTLMRAKGEHSVRGKEEKIKTYTLYSSLSE